MIEGFGANLRSTMRFIRRAPSFAFAVIMTLALGIGANSAVFSAIDAILLRPLPFPHGGELIRFHQRDFKHKNPETFVASLRLEDWHRMNSSFQSISGYYTGDANFSSGSPPEEARVALVAPRFSHIVGVSPGLD